MTDFFAQVARRAWTSHESPRPAVAPLFAPGPKLASATSMSPLEEAEPGYVEHDPVPATSLLAPETIGKPISRSLRDRKSDAKLVQPSENAPVVGYLPRPAPEGSTLPAPQVDDLSRPPITFRPQIVPAPAPSRIPRPEEGGAGETPRSLLKSAGPKAIDLQPQRETDINQHRRLERDQVTPAAPPLVRVSIGRVEVRAVVTSQPAPSTRAAQAQPVPRSFLQEYLQERNRGTR